MTCFRVSPIMMMCSHPRDTSSHQDVVSTAPSLAFTRYSFTSKLLCTSESSLSCPSPSALPTLLQYYCTTIAQYMTPPPPPFCMPYTIQNCYWQYPVKANPQRHTAAGTAAPNITCTGNTVPQRAKFTQTAYADPPTHITVWI